MANERRRNVDDEMLGVGEPDFGETITDANDPKLIKAYQYYNYYFRDKPVGVKVWNPMDWIPTYLEKLGKPAELIEAFKKVKESKIAPVYPAIARMHTNGLLLPKAVLDRLNKKIVALVNEEPVEKVIYIDIVPKKNIQDYIQDNAKDLIAEVEEVIDQLINSFEKPDFKMYNFLTERKVSARIAKIIGEHFKLQHLELVEAFNNNPEFKEGYAHLTRAQLKKHVEFFADLVDDCFKFGGNRVTTRKPRKKKVKSATILAKGVNYQKEDVNLKLVSVDPAKIVGATSVYLFNTKTSTLTVLNAQVSAGLSVKGTTVGGFDPATSISKKAGRAIATLNEVVTGGKVTLRRVMDGIKAKGNIANGRIGSDTLILRVI